MSNESKIEILGSLERVEMEVEELQERLDYLSTKRDKVQQELEHIMDSVQEVLKQKKDQLVDTLNDLFTTERQRILIDIRDKQDLVSEARIGLFKMSDLIRTGLEEEAASLGLSLEETCRHGSSLWEEEETRVNDFNLNVDFDGVMAVVENLNVGELVTVLDDKGQSLLDTTVSPSSTSRSTSTSPPDTVLEDKDVLPDDSHVIHTRTKGDDYSPKLSDIEVVDVAGITTVIVTDKANKKVKAFYEREGSQFYSAYTSSHEPRGIAKCGDSRVAVTFPQVPSIKLINVLPYLTRKRRIKTGKRYRGITALDERRLAVATDNLDPAAVDIIDLNGLVLKSFVIVRGGESLFVAPFYLCTCQGDIIVSDCETQSITGLSQDGVVSFRHARKQGGDIKHPLGVAGDNSGNILAVDCDNHKVIQINREYDDVKDVLDKHNGLHASHGIAVDRQGKVYIAEWRGTIRVFSNISGSGRGRSHSM